MLLITNSQKNPIDEELKNELINSLVELSGYDYYNIELSPNEKDEDFQGDEKFSVHYYGM